MGKVITGIVMSLDGFVTGEHDGVQQLFKWYFDGSVEVKMPSGFVLKVSPQSAELLQGAIRTNGAMVTGRRNFDVANAWGGKPPFIPTVVLTHNVPQDWVRDGSPFIFVTDGIESAIRLGKQAAGDKNVAVATPRITQQCLKAGLLDEIHIDLVPVLLGEGIRLFEHLGIEPVELESTQVVAAPGVTHLTFRVVK